jgi:pyruvate ferredoxin oxidoreductase alpha subunit
MPVVTEKKMIIKTGNDAMAEAMRQINPDVVAAYPITPSTVIMETFAKYLADGEVDTELVTVESEHSAMSACVGAAAAGARVMNATAANGLALMFEILCVASGLRLPLVLGIANRPISSPLNIHGDHSDTLSCREAGWIQLYSETNQEVYDNMIQAVKISEHPDVRTPVMVCMDGFQTSHNAENLFVESDAWVQEFVGTYKPSFTTLLDVNNPTTHGAYDLPNWLFEHKREQHEAIVNAPEIIAKVGKDFGKATGREYGFIEEYRMEDAEYAIVAMNATAGTAKHVCDEMRESGIKAGVLKIRVFRPFPFKEVAESLKQLKAVAVFDRMFPNGAQGGVLFNEIRSSLYNYAVKPVVVNYIYGIGGRDLLPRHVKAAYNRLLDIDKTGEVGPTIDFLNMRE